MKKDIVLGCSVILVIGLICLGLGIIIGKYWL